MSNYRFQKLQNRFLVNFDQPKTVQKYEVLVLIHFYSDHRTQITWTELSGFHGKNITYEYLTKNLLESIKISPKGGNVAIE